MADKEISSLPAAGSIENEDLFVLEQNGIAKKLSGELLKLFSNATRYETVTTLPATGEPNVIYLLTSGSTTTMYVYSGGAWQNVGTLNTTAGDATPLMDGTASPGSALPYSRQDHRHPSDSSKAEKAIMDAVVEPLINQWDEQWEVGTYDLNTGRPAVQSAYFRTKNAIKVKPSTTYYLHSNGGLYTLFYDANDGYISFINERKNISITTPPNAAYMRFVNVDSNVYNHDISINYPSTYTGYYPSALPKAKAHIGGLGNAIAMKGWNQLVKNGNFENTDIWFVNNATLSVSGNVGSVTISGTDGNIAQRITPIVGHKYLISADVKPSAASMQIRMIYNTAEWSVSAYLTGTTEWSRMSAVGVMDSGTTRDVFYIRGINGSSFQVKNVNVIDLTSLFGAGNEPASVEDFRAMFPADYYPYCSGAWADLLWENASIGSDFSAQDISVNLSNYTFVAIEFQHYKTQGKGIVSSIRVGESACLFGMSGTNGISGDSINGALQVGARALTTTSTKVHFGNGYVSNSGGIFSQNDGCGIPIRIYGIR